MIGLKIKGGALTTATRGARENTWKLQQKVEAEKLGSKLPTSYIPTYIRRIPRAKMTRRSLITHGQCQGSARSRLLRKRQCSEELPIISIITSRSFSARLELHSATEQQHLYHHNGTFSLNLQTQPHLKPLTKYSQHTKAKMSGKPPSSTVSIYNFLFSSTPTNLVFHPV